MFDEAISFFCGEKKYISAFVVAKDPNETVVITDADYELFDISEKEVVESGKCDFNANELTILLGIAKKGIYRLKITVKVGAEIFIQKSTVWVEE